MKLRLLATTASALLTYFPSQAAIVSGTHYTTAGKLVNLQQLEWLSLDSTRGFSRHEVRQGALGYAAAGWRYATRLETSALLMSLWGGTYSGGSTDNGDGADWFFKNIGQGNILFGEAVLRNFFYGSTSECATDQELSCHGQYGAAFSNVGLPPTGWFYTDYGLDATYPNSATVSIHEKSDRFGHLMVRGNSVPEPSALLLTLFALVVLGTVARGGTSAA